LADDLVSEVQVRSTDRAVFKSTHTLCSDKAVDLFRRTHEEHRRVAHSDGLFAGFIECILLTEKLKKRLGKLTDKQIAELVDAVVCDNLQAFSPEIVICEEAAARLFRSPAGSFTEQDGQDLNEG